MAQDKTDYLFEPEKLTRLSRWKDICDKLKEYGHLIARPLEANDFTNGYLELLSQLTHVGCITKDGFEARFAEMKQINLVQDHYIVVVIEDSLTGKIVGASTLFLELKFIHECARRGRLEDVATLSSYRGKNIGQMVVSIIVDLAREVYNCYKITLDCSDDLKKFYAKNKFNPDCNMLSIRFDKTG